MAHIHPVIFRAYDIRGIAMPEKGQEADLTAISAYIIGIATGEYFREVYGPAMETEQPEQSEMSWRPRLIVGRDNRLSGPELHRAFILGLVKAGCEVINAGLTTSPMIYWATCAMPLDGGINITASHNPKEYNGIKIVAKGAHSICGEELQKILKRAERIEEELSRDAVRNIFGEAQIEISAPENVTPAAPTVPEETPISANYIEDLLHRAELHRPLKVVIDAGNATTGAFAPGLFKKFGCEVIPLFCNLDGNYPNHEANPEEEKNLKDLAALVREEGADIGIAFDGDGDRVGIVDERGRQHSADFLLLILAKDLLERSPGSQIVFDVKVSQLLISGIRDAKGVPVMCKTGHSFIESKMKEIHAPLGGEISGHFFFAENYYGFDDAFLAALRLLEIFSKSPKRISEHFDALPHMSTTPEYKLRCPDNRKFDIIGELTDHFTKDYPCITIDGVRVNFDTSSWGAIRCSNTSPNLTARFEAPSDERLDNIKDIFLKKLKTYPEIDVAPMRANK